MKKKNNPIYKIIFSIIGIILFILLVVLYIILPSINYIQNIKKDIQTTEQYTADQLEKMRLLTKSLAQLDTITENTKLLEQSLITKNDDATIKLIQELEDLASSQNIEQTLSINPEQDNNFVISFKIKTSFDKTLQYLNSLERLPIYLTINNLNWTKVDSENVSLIFEAIIYTK
ncbi:MAG: hypothetical protein AUJ23_01405 [Candidatus Magasanikbacteria bacterium CG1_02_32_51]|uniref:Uncharacterized protein n=1 Tax=Candidatus Magasanikbacteria bacterium CG1_02_32_51 TaxID=1805238 RepID=A0A1J4UAP7_9BACT|nr:MAG: hypothetical protein AUJ23_01405 [Candidatus Magasanikbacteria bacterium CG1_02_32_51]